MSSSEIFKPKTLEEEVDEEGHPSSSSGPYTRDDVIMKGGGSHGDDNDEDNYKGNNNKDDKDDDDGEMHVTLGCGILGRYPIISLVSFVVAGICLGVGLSYWRPTDEVGLNGKAITLQWLGLIGDLFLM
jgi:hypothetical protein